MQRFLPFLPDGDGAAGGEALALIADDLEWLLTVDAAELWAVARADPSLAMLVASFLQYAKCVWPQCCRGMMMQRLDACSKCWEAVQAQL